MDDNELITLALAHAARAHQGQTDKRGRPYIQHVTEVSSAVDHEGTHAIIVALLHDVLEDGKEHHKDLSAYPQQVQDAVHAITRKAGETYQAYIERVAQNPLARTVKLADLRLNHATAPQESLKKRYAQAIRRLEQDTPPPSAPNDPVGRLIG